MDFGFRRNDGLGAWIQMNESDEISASVEAGHNFFLKLFFKPAPTMYATGLSKKILYTPLFAGFIPSKML
jgi:hypothetical protein